MFNVRSVEALVAPNLTIGGLILRSCDRDLTIAITIDPRSYGRALLAGISIFMCKTQLDLYIFTCVPEGPGLDLCIFTCVPEGPGLDLCICYVCPGRPWAGSMHFHVCPARPLAQRAGSIGLSD